MAALSTLWRASTGMPAPMPDIDTATPAVVLKLGDNLFDHGGLGAVRSLGRLGVPVYWVDRTPKAPALASRYLRDRWLWQPDADDVGQVCQGLRLLAERIGRPSVVIPTDDLSAIFLAEHGAALRPWFLFPAPPTDLPRRLVDKYELASLCRDLHVPGVAMAPVHSFEEASEFAAKVGFPLAVKVRVPWQNSPARRNRRTTLVDSRQQLAALFTQVRTDAGLLVQEHIPGGPGHDWFFHGYCDGTATCQPAFTGVKDRSYPAFAGPTSLGHAAPNERLAAQVRDMLARMSYRGIMDLDIRLDPRDQCYKVLDFNPRLGAQFRVCLNSAGVDVAVATHLDLTGRPIPEAGQIYDRAFLVENFDAPAAFGYWRQGELGLRRWLTSVRGVDEVAWFAWDDLRPFGLMCARIGERIRRRVIKK